MRKHYAKAITSKPSVKLDEWVETLRSNGDPVLPKDYLHRTAKTVLRKCDPNQYLLSHATIVASVDTYATKKVKTGRQYNRGIQIDVRWPEFSIKPECHEIINNNGDSWERSLLLSTYKTFVGAANYLEHIQLPELSKGFIVDAVARDLGKTCYIDILVATDRKHQKLVSDILSGDIDSMSMGCVSLFTICSRCGNVAADDATLCPCVSYDGKGTKFIDEDGIEQVISELIGHVSVPNSNQFIEASWVRDPAFGGAQRRNLLNADQITTQMASNIASSSVIYELKREIPIIDGLKKAASKIKVAQGQQDQPTDVDDDMGFGDQSQDQSSDDQEQSQSSDDQSSDDQGQSSDLSDDGKSKPTIVDELINKAQEQLLSLIVDGLSERLTPKVDDVGTVAPIDISSSNDNLMRGASVFNKGLKSKFAGNDKLITWASKVWNIVHVGGIKAIKNAGLSSKDLIVFSWIEDRINSKELPSIFYKTAMKLGSIDRFPSETSYLAMCKVNVGHNLSAKEQQFFTIKGRIASMVNS